MPAMPRTSAIARAAPRTLRSRLVLTSVLATLVIWVAFGVYLVVAARTLYVNRLSAQLATQARLVGEAIRPTLASGGDVDPLVKRLGSGAGERVTVIALDGRVLGDSEADPRTMENHAGRPEVKAALASGQGEAQRHSATLDENFLYVADKISGSPAVVVRIALPLGEVDAAIHRIQRDVIIAAAGAGLLAAIAALIAAARIAGPLVDLRRQTSAVAAGRLDARVQPAATRELGELGRAFNAMTQRLGELRDQVAQSHDRLEATLANLSDGVVVTGADGAVVDLNPAAARMLGVAEEAAIGQPFIVASRDHDLAGLLDAALATGETRTASVELGREPRVLETTAQPLADGRERLGLVVLRDVTELRRLEAMRREFVANVSHELRTPLASIRLLVETLEAGAAQDSEVAASLFRQAVAEIDHLTGLVDELLDLARLESGHLVLRLEERDPGELLGRAADRLRPQSERAGVELRVASTAGAGLVVRVDQVRIEQALLNLIHNAIKFTPAGGAITLSAEARGKVVRLAVSDTGAGIAAAELPRIFERFYKRDPARRSPGAGLGLAIAKHIVQAHGGAIGAESAPGRGTTIWIDLPAAHD